MLSRLHDRHEDQCIPTIGARARFSLARFSPLPVDR